MATLTISKKHHKHINNPFPAATPKTVLPLLHGKLFFNNQKLPSNQIYTIGKDFQLNWSSKDGGFLTISPESHHERILWSTIPGEAFISAAIAETQVEESRGSFVIKDKHVHFVCNHQTIEDIKIINELCDITEDQNFPSVSQFPVLMVTGKVFGTTQKRNMKVAFSRKEFKKESCTSARYWLLFDQKNSNQVGLQVRIEQPNFEIHEVSPRSYRRSFSLKHGWRRRRFFSRKKTVSSVSSEEENVVIKTSTAASNIEFNRICVTYSSERTEKFFGFGEQFSHMDFKGKRVPIIVQEQGIGRGDQPITFAANLVSYRAGGDWSTTYAPSPFYMTSKMRSLYLEGYNYSVFDLTGEDRVQIQVHGDSFEGRILYGSSPCELIEHFTESIGRPPPLPEWIISGAVVGMQGGTDTVRATWNELIRHISKERNGS